MLSIRSLQLVLALNRFRSFSRAAASLGVSQPSLTRSLKGAKAGAAAKKGARAAPKTGKAAAKKTTRAKAAPARKSEERKAA